MTTDQLERELADVKRELRELKLAVEALHPMKKPGILSIVGSMAEFPDFDDVVAYGRYFRKTGQQPPPEWNPGDSIPDVRENTRGGLAE